MSVSIFLFTPPFTQLNTPYPATAYLKGFLNTKGVSSFQADLGIEVTNALFSKEKLTNIFNLISLEGKDENIKRIAALKTDYLNTIDATIHFLQGKNPTLAQLICSRNFLPEASRFEQLSGIDLAFGKMGNQDKAKHLATLYLEDLSDLIVACVDEHFGFSRYAERLGRSANSFDEIYDSLQQPLSYVDELTIENLKEKIEYLQPKLVAISVPFPGNLFSAFRCAQWLRMYCPNVKVAMGGGFANTELRSLKDARVFEFFHYITLDDGEAPIENLLKFIEGQLPIHELKRTFLLQNGEVVFYNYKQGKDYKQGEVGTPDYSNLLLDKYISAIEVTNPMHSLWSDGRWNKLTMAHGCYWGKCTFCDVSLDYIQRYEPITAGLLCDRMEELIAQTGQSGFHFVDEAAPPALMRALALEIIKRQLVVTWWANIRFEKSFTRDLCFLLKASGCIAVSGGLEVASDRLLALIQKGITVAQVAKVNKNFTDAGIMVHAYLMYGFPTQTAQETIDSLEMVRQMFQAGIMQSAFWHQFAMTAHSPIGLEPAKFGVHKKTETLGYFANNDIEHIDPTGAEHETFGYGLKKSLHNYMHGVCFDFPLQKWFDHKVPKTIISPSFIEDALNSIDTSTTKDTTKVVFIGHQPIVELVTKSKKGNTWQVASLQFQTRSKSINIKLPEVEGLWLAAMLPKLAIGNTKTYTIKELRENFEQSGLSDFELFWDNKPMSTMHEVGLLQL